MKRKLFRVAGSDRRINQMDRPQCKYVGIPARTPADVLLDKAWQLGEYPPEFFRAWYALESTELRAKKPTARYQ